MAAILVSTSSCSSDEAADRGSRGILIRQSKNLHLLLHTLSKYLASAPHLPPVSPKLPDMHSSTASYIALQNLFKQQFLLDLQRFKLDLAHTLSTVGLADNAIPDEEVENFARNVAAVGIVKGTALSERKRIGELTKQTIRALSS